MGVAFVGSNLADNTTLSYTPTAGNDLIVQVIGSGGSSALTSLTDSVGGATVLSDFAYTLDSTSHVGIGVFRVHNATAVSHTFTANFSTLPGNGFFLVVSEVSGISGLDSGAGTVSLATGTSTTPTTGSLTPTANGDFLLAAAGTNPADTITGWNNGFTTIQSFASGPTMDTAYLVQSSAASINATLTIGSSFAWAATLLAYAGPAATNSAPIAWIT